MVLIVGIPNSGKTTYSHHFDNVIHFDKIPHINPNEQYQKCNALAAQADGNVVVEGVYNSQRRRVEFLEAVKHKEGKKVCIWLDTPLEVCLEREQNFRKRPLEMVLQHAKRFEPPTLDEGWDEIIIIRGEENG